MAEVHRSLGNPEAPELTNELEKLQEMLQCASLELLVPWDPWDDGPMGWVTKLYKKQPVFWCYPVVSSIQSAASFFPPEIYIYIHMCIFIYNIYIYICVCVCVCRVVFSWISWSSKYLFLRATVPTEDGFCSEPGEVPSRLRHFRSSPFSQPWEELGNLGCLYGGFSGNIIPSGNLT